MKIVLAKHIGFCSGVKRAILIAKTSLKEETEPVQFLGSLIHNENVVREFLKKGIIFRKNLKEIKPGVLIIQAHGFPPFPKNFDKKILIKDATCPLVKKVQSLVSSFRKQGYQIVIIGEKHHSETKGIKGYAKNQAIIVENIKDAGNLPKLKRIVVVAQTTQDINNVNEILKILRRRCKKVKFFNTLCPEVQFRQKEVKLIVKKTDAVLIIGSKSSANAKRLYQISKTSGKPVWWINSLEELKKQKINNSIVLGILSGTSADNSEIEKIKKYLEKAKRTSSVESKTRRKKKY
jgi:4-hydroxy-3-methylbut-2-enyl diphosphate reductase